MPHVVSFALWNVGVAGKPPPTHQTITQAHTPHFLWLNFFVTSQINANLKPCPRTVIHKCVPCDSKFNKFTVISSDLDL